MKKMFVCTDFTIHNIMYYLLISTTNNNYHNYRITHLYIAEAIKLYYTKFDNFTDKNEGKFRNYSWNMLTLYVRPSTPYVRPHFTTTLLMFQADFQPSRFQSPVPGHTRQAGVLRRRISSFPVGAPLNITNLQHSPCRPKLTHKLSPKPPAGVQRQMRERPRAATCPDRPSKHTGLP